MVQNNKLQLIYLVIICLLLITSVGCDLGDTESQATENGETIEPEFETEEIRGNSAGNIISGARVVRQGEWLYYSYRDDPKSDNTWGNIYKTSLDGSVREKINDDISWSINVVGDWVYYCNIDDNSKIYKIRTDGSERTKIGDDHSGFITVIGDWIYYINWNDKHSIYKIRTDGSKRTKINDVNSMFINVAGDWIYYINDENKNIYKVHTDGSGLTKLNDERSSFINVVDDWIYYLIVSTLYRVRIDGTGREKLNDHSIDHINVTDGVVYYINSMDGSTIFKVNTDGEDNKRIIDDSVMSFNIVDDWIYYINKSENGEFYRIKTDGSQRAAFGNYAEGEQSAFEPVEYIVDVVDGSNLFIRKSPGTSNKLEGDILDRIPGGSLLVVTNNHGNKVFIDDYTWWEIKVPGTNLSGWAAAEYLIKKSDQLGTDSYSINDKCDESIEYERRGNTSGNIGNNGYAARKDDWIFFNYYVYDIPWDDNGWIKKIRTDGSGLEDVNNDYSTYINIYGDWIYYSNYDDNSSIYKITIDGRGRSKINDDSSSYLNVVDGWIYYINGSDGHAIYKIRTDGSERTKLYEHYTMNLNVVGDSIYFLSSFINTDGTRLDTSYFKMNLDGGDLEKLDYGGLIIDDGWFYYADGNDRHRIYRIRIDGSDLQLVSKDRARSLNVYCGWVYYKNRDEDNAVYRIRTDGTGRTKITDHYTGYQMDYGWFNVVGDWIIYFKEIDDIGFYRIRTDGSEWQKVI